MRDNVHLDVLHRVIRLSRRSVQDAFPPHDLPAFFANQAKSGKKDDSTSVVFGLDGADYQTTTSTKALAVCLEILCGYYGCLSREWEGLTNQVSRTRAVLTLVILTRLDNCVRL
jgi:hypothetical protein